jgi:hypothetical protein
MKIITRVQQKPSQGIGIPVVVPNPEVVGLLAPNIPVLPKAPVVVVVVVGCPNIPVVVPDPPAGVVLCPKVPPPPKVLPPKAPKPVAGLEAPKADVP